MLPTVAQNIRTGSLDGGMFACWSSFWNNHLSAVLAQSRTLLFSCFQVFFMEKNVVEQNRRAHEHVGGHDKKCTTNTQSNSIDDQARSINGYGDDVP